MSEYQRSIFFVLSVFSLLCFSRNVFSDVVANETNNALSKNTETLSYTTTEQAVNDRRRQAEKARNDLNKGAKTAEIVGGSLIGTGSAMMPFNPGAGSILIMKGALELAQAAANRKQGATNNDQAVLLQNGGTYTGYVPNTGYGSLVAQHIYNSPLGQTLSNKGINVDDFSNRLASGQSNLESAFGEIYGTPDFGPNSYQQALSVSRAEEEKALGKVADPEKTKVAYDETKEGSNNADNNSFFRGALDEKLSSDSLTLQGVKKEDKDKAHQNGDEKLYVDGVGAGEKNKSDSEGVDQLSKWTSILGGSQEMQGVDSNTAKFLVKEQLLSKGVKVSRTGENIFQMANKNFRDYSKWRKHNPEIVRGIASK